MVSTNNLRVLLVSSWKFCASGFVSAAVATHYPAMAARMEQINEKLADKFGKSPEFGLFWNFCVNAPYEEVRDVICRPHVDAMNGAVLLCAVFVFYIGEGESSFSI